VEFETVLVARCLVWWFQVYFSVSMSHAFRSTWLKSWRGNWKFWGFSWIPMLLLVFPCSHIFCNAATSTGDTAFLCNHAVGIKLVMKLACGQIWIRCCPSQKSQYTWAQWDLIDLWYHHEATTDTV
jgi:hypothetical protein